LRVGKAVRCMILKEFFKKIKAECPETIFQGTDVGHRYFTVGKRFLNYLENNGIKDSEQYKLTEDTILQGKLYYKRSNNEFREDMMTKNFIREFESLDGEDIMGIYGAAHTGLDSPMRGSKTIPCMGKRLKERYGDLYIQRICPNWKRISNHTESI